MRVVLPFKLVGQKLVKGRDFPKSVADGSKDSVVIKVGGIPDGCIAKGYFKLSWESNTTYDLTFDGDELVVDEYIVTLPSYANNKYIDYKFSFSVAIWEGDVERLTTNPVEIVVEKSNYVKETTNTPDIPESQYDEILSVASVALSTANEAKKTASAAQNLANGLDGTVDELLEAKGDHEERITALEQNGGGGGGDVSAVRFTEQELTDEQKAQARKNIGAGLPPLRFTVTKGGGTATSSKTYQELYDAHSEGRALICVFDGVDLPLISALPNAFIFTSNIYGTTRQVTVHKSNDIPASARIDTKSIKIGDQIWGGDDEEWDVDFTDTINEMIDEKVSNNQRIVNAREFGAKGDGVTDDTEAIQAALHYAEDNGLPLYIPAGNYLVSKTISTYTRDTDADKQSKALNIYGSGMSTVFTTADGFEGDFVFYIDAKSTQPRMVWVHDFAFDLTVDVSGIYFRDLGMKSVVENLWINFNYLKQETDIPRSGIYCDYSVVSTFQRIKVQGKHTGLDGKRPMNCGITVRDMTTTKFIDCDVIFCGWALYLGGGTCITIEDCRVDENDYGVFQHPVSPVDNAPTAYKVSPITGEEFDGCFKGLTISKNRFEANNRMSVYLVSNGVGSMNYMFNNELTISDNYFTGLGAGTAKWHDDRSVFRKAILLGRCDGVTVERNLFSGQPFDSTNSESYYQNIHVGAQVLNFTLRDNVVPPRLTGENDAYGNAIAVEGNKKMPDTVCAAFGWVNNIEANQTTRKENAVRRSYPASATASGAVDVSKTNILYLADGVSVDTINLESGADALMSQEVTFVAVGTTATIKSTGRIKLAGGVDFVMGEFDTITFERVYIYPRGNFWVEKSRSVNRAVTE